MMAITYDNVNDLAALLREDGDKILDASSKLSLSTTLLHRLNSSFNKLFKQSGLHCGTFDVVSSSSDIIDSFLDIQFVYDFLQKTVALKLLPGPGEQQVVDINVFRNLKLLEIHRFSLSLVKGVKSLRTQLQYLTCMRSLSALKEVLEWCGADKSQGFVWCELKEAVFSHNGLNALDTSLEFTPCLQALDLSHNRIQNAQPLNCLLHLKYLNLSFNKLESVPAFTSNMCNRLQVLVLHNNCIEDIQEVAALSNLRELDLSDNCLMEHRTLCPLSNLPMLQWLCLKGNPFSYHPQHRLLTSRYLHSNSASVNFIFEHVALSRAEQRLVGSLHPLPVPLERSSSFNSIATASTVVPASKDIRKEGTPSIPEKKLDVRIEGPLESTTLTEENAAESENERERNMNVWLQDVAVQEMLGMQDSGFVAGPPRPSSPSGSSIDCAAVGTIGTCVVEPVERQISFKKDISSATSLDSTIEDNRSNHAVRYCESDIEVLSNPSQSSIEVLDSGPTRIRCVQSASTITTQTIQTHSTKGDLNKMCEQHRSL